MSLEINRLITAIQNETITESVADIVIGCNGEADALRDQLTELFQSIPADVMKNAGFELWDDIDEGIMLKITSTRWLTEEEKAVAIQEATDAVSKRQTDIITYDLNAMKRYIDTYPEQAARILKEKDLAN